MITPAQVDAIGKLNNKYYTILNLISCGYSYKETAWLMKTPYSSVRNIRSVIYKRIGVKNAVQASTILTEWKRLHIDSRKNSGIMF